MDELVVKYYRRLCREGFEHNGEIKSPDIFLDTVGEKIRICSHVSHAYLHIYIRISEGKIEDIKYLCTCDPTANVVVEILCSILKGKTIIEAEALTENDFTNALGSTDDEFLKKVRGIIELLHRGLDRYKAGIR
ncbi:MAG: iron-sulfur cluster assembly scaffold protein [Dehalococcoidales bacterium]|nr:iron-sulfur cluster assembly scaffold protein [Dehalococcoidales bacterium]